MDSAHAHRNIVVIGGSAGSLTALLAIAAGLPADLPAAILVALHMHPEARSQLPQMVSARGPLRAVHPVHGEAIVPGTIYIAPPDTQLVPRPGFVQFVRGPKENGHRPSIDVLFRSAARAYRNRVIGVVLTGFGDCGTSGLLSIRARGGVAVVQDPSAAAVPGMPRSALERAQPDYVADVSELAGLIARLVAEPPRPASTPGRDVQELEGDEPGVPLEIVCPLCSGSMTVSGTGGFAAAGCHVGHTFSLDRLELDQAEATERAMWSAIRALEESAALSSRMVERSGPDLAQRFADRRDEQLRSAQVIRDLLLGGASAVVPESG